MTTFEGYPEISGDEIRDALDFCGRQILKNLPEFTEKFQNAYSENGFYRPIENDYWTCGFWTGEIWLAYEHTRDERSVSYTHLRAHET